MAIDSITGSSLKISFSYNAEKKRTGQQPLKSQESFVRTMSLGTAAGATTAGGANEVVYLVRSVGPNASDVLDLSAAQTNVVGDASITLARIKSIACYLLGATEFAGPTGAEQTGSACTAIRFGACTSDPAKLFFATTASAIDILNKSFAAVGSAGPLGYHLSSGMNDKLAIQNLDGTYTASYVLGFFGGAT